MNPIYLDNNSTTAISPQVLDKMLPYMNENYGNPASSEHMYGWQANQAVDVARKQISDLVNCSPNEIYFTSGATESNNISILGLIESIQSKKHTVTVKTEHKSVLDIFKNLSKKNISTIYLDVNNKGIVDLNEISECLTSDISLLSIMMANNEIGVIQPIKEIGDICRGKGITLHVDAAQAMGKIDIDLKKLNVDLMSFSAHKLYAPKGVGAIYINSETTKNKLKPIIFGGGHESGFRPGTLAVHNIVGFGEACKIAKEEINDNYKSINSLRDVMLNNLSGGFDDLIINGSMQNRIPGNLNISFPGLNKEPFIQKFREIAISSGSACTTSNPSPSHVLQAIGLKKSLIECTMRIGIGKFNTLEEIEFAADYILEIVNKLKTSKRG